MKIIFKRTVPDDYYLLLSNR